MLTRGRPRTAPDPAAGSVDPGGVRAMFDGIARFYDLLNTVLSGGRDAAWRRRAVAAARLRRGDRALDVCTGTGVLARGLRGEVGAEGSVLGVDFSAGMLAVARRRIAGVDFREGDATDLRDVAAGSVDAVTMAFGLRNIPDRPKAVAEAFRVLRPGGRFVLLEFSQVRGRLTGAAYRWYLTRLLPRVGGFLNPRSAAYQYLPASIAGYPGPEAVSVWLRSAGFDPVTVASLTFGVVTLHVGVRPSPGPAAGAPPPPSR